MTRVDRPVGDRAAWDGSPAAVAALRDVIVEHASTGTLRLVLQQLTLREAGREVGRHEVIDAISDVGGNLVAIPLVAAVRADAGSSQRLDAAIDRLRAEISAELGAAADSLEVVLDADGRESVHLMFDLEVSPQALAGGAALPVLRDGAHHIAHQSHALDDLRDRMAQPDPGPLRRAWDAVTAPLRRGR